MATISENLEAIKTAKASIKSAIENKGQDLTDVPFTQYGEKIADIKSEPNLTTKEITANGTYNASDDGVDGYSSVDVNVPTPDLSQTTATADDVLEGKEFFNASGEKVAGTYKDMLQARIDVNNKCNNLFYYYYGDNVDFIKNLDTSKVTDMSSMFSHCEYIKTVPLFDTSNVTTMKNMFNSCGDLVSVPLFDTSKVTDMSSMFENCYDLRDVPDFNANNVTTMANMFKSCSKGLISVSLSNTSSVTSMNSMFYYCSKLKEVTFKDTSKVTNMSSMFRNCEKLTTVNNLNTSSATGTENMFRTCSGLISLPTLDFSSTTSLSESFYGCSSLQTLSLQNTQNCKYFNNLVGSAKALTTLSGVDLYNATTVFNLVAGCSNLTNLTVKNVRISLTIGSGTSYGHLLTLDSLLNTIKELWTNTGTSTLTLTMGTANTAKLADVYVKLIDITDEMRAEDEYIDNKAPFVVCESTDEGAMLITEYVTNIKKWQLA